jgi:hypothetical protein
LEAATLWYEQRQPVAIMDKKPNRKSQTTMRWKVFLLILIVLRGHVSSAEAQTRVQDIFGRALNQSGITLVDWDGYMANPLIKFYLLPPTNAVLPGSATLTANGARLYFGVPSTVSATGPSTVISLANSTTPVPGYLSIFPAHSSSDGTYTLTIVFTDANDAKQTTTLPINVIDEDTRRTNAFVVTANFGRDIAQFFTNGTARLLVSQAANDWTYYFTGMNLDTVKVGTETTYIWSNNFNGGYYFVNTNSYTGYQLYAYGTTNATDISGGEGSYSGPAQSSGGVPLTMKRSGGFEANILGNYNTLYWLFLTNDDDWLETGNLGNQTNDFYSIAHHEVGHALIFNQAHPGFATALAKGAFTSAAVTNYYGGPVPIDASDDHLTGVIDPESGQGAFGYEYYGNIPRQRWTMTKMDLLCAQEVGYVLQPSSAFAPFALATNAVPASYSGVPFTFTFAVTGGIPVYDWDITAGSLPPGLALDSFSGTLAGTPATNGVFNFTVRARDYHEASSGLAQNITLSVGPPPPVRLAISPGSGAAGNQAQISFFGVPGEQQITQASSNLLIWTPISTNTFVTNLFQLPLTNTLQFPSQFYRSVIVP